MRKTFFSEIFDLYYKILNEISNFDFYYSSRENYNKAPVDIGNSRLYSDAQIENNFLIDNKISNSGFRKTRIKNERYFHFYQNVFQIIIENISQLFLGLQNSREENQQINNIMEDDSFSNFSKRFFNVVKINFEKFSKHLNSGYNYDLMQNILNLYSDYATLIGFKYNLKAAYVETKNNKNYHINKINYSEEDLLYDIIEILRNSHFQKYSDSIKYALKNSITE